MKKFWIFILGVITAIVGFFIFTDKTPTADTPPINNEQQQPGDNTGDDNNNVNPDDPSDVGGEVTYADISIQTIDARLYFYDSENNLVNSNHLILGETYTVQAEAFDGYYVLNYGVTDIWGNQTGQTTFVAVDNIQAYAFGAHLPSSATVNCQNPNVTAVFYDMGYNQVTNFNFGNQYKLELQYDSSTTTIYNVKVDGSTIYQMDESGWDLMNMTFNAPDHDFVVEITTTADLYACSYTVNFTEGHFSRIDITNTGGGVQPSQIYGGTVYQLNFETHAGFYVTEVYLNNELLQTYEAGGIASGSVQFTAPNADFELRVVTVG